MDWFLQGSDHRHERVKKKVQIEIRKLHESTVKRETFRSFYQYLKNGREREILSDGKE